MKKLLALGLAASLSIASLAAVAGCGETKDPTENPTTDVPAKEVKVGLITLHDKNSTYDKNFIEAMEAACAATGAELILRTGVEEDRGCYDTAADLVDQGCDVIFADSFGHQYHMIDAAREFPEVQFCHATGTNANGSGLDNYQNAFASIYEGRYLAGVVAGMKLVEMYNDGKITAANYTESGDIKIGYVGAYTYAEVISGYTSFYLGVKSVLAETEGMPGVAMDVTFTGSWYDETAEKESAENLISRGAALISQHADSMGAPRACESAGVPNVSYNGSTADACPNTFLVSSKIDWVPYFTYMIECVQKGEDIVTDWCGDIETGSVKLTDFGSACAAGTAEKVEAVQAELQAGTRSVFDCSTFTVNGAVLTEYAVNGVNVVVDGVFQESMLPGVQSAPYFDIQIDGITLLNTAF
ncbi:MAG: BMP family ABC transporter substrate-binding protein [Christensenellaceae bacterium]